MVHIVLDLEMNKLSKSYVAERKICIQEIIEIGAVALDESYKELGYFKTLVKPQYNEKINSNIERLTGIKTDMVQNSPYFAEALDSFVTWIQDFGQEIDIYGWSESDVKQFKHEIRLKNITDPKLLMILNWEWHDFQKEYGELLGLERSISLEQAVYYAGYDFEGRQHDALFDARNTAKLLELSRDEKRFQKTLKVVLDALHPQEESYKLGSLFDFSQFMVQEM